MSIAIRRPLVSATLIAAHARFSEAQSPPAAQSSVVSPGCYRLTLGPWSRASSLGPDKPTAVIRLDTIARTPGARGWLVAERVDPPEFAPQGDSRLHWQQPAHWVRVDADSVMILAWSTGTEAEVFYGRWSSGSLAGVMRHVSDAVPVDPKTHKILWSSWPWARASAAPAPCP